MLAFHPVDDGIDAGRITIAAVAGAQIIGVALADIRAGLLGSLQSIFVSEHHRGRGVAQGLVHMLERQARSRGVRRLTAVYSGAAHTAPAMTRILAKQGWAVPSAPTLILNGSTRIIEAAWMKTRVGSAYEVFTWSELTPSETAGLADANGDAQWYPAWLGPLPEEPVEPACSIGLRYEGQVVGWMLTHRVSPERVRYSRLFVKREHRGSNCGVALIAEAIRRQHAAGILECLCAVASDNEPMMRMVGRRLAPYIESRTDVCHASKNLTPLC